MKKFSKNTVQLLSLPSHFDSVFMKMGILIVSLFVVIAFMQTGSCEAEIYTQKIEKLSIGDKTVLRDVVDDIFKQTGYKIVVSDELALTPIAGVYEDVSVENFLRRVFKKYNVSVIYDEKAKVAFVRAFGENLNKDQKGAYVAVPKEGLLEDGESDPSAVDPLSGISLAELKRTQIEQLEEMERLRNDPETLDPLSGTPLMELQRAQSQQLEEMERQKKDSEAVDPLTDNPLAEQQRSVAEQLEEMEKRNNDPAAVDPLSGDSLSELRAGQARQLEELGKRENDPNAVDPLENIPLSDLPQ